MIILYIMLNKIKNKVIYKINDENVLTEEHKEYFNDIEDKLICIEMYELYYKNIQ